jgi:hypothetical protein
MIYSESNRTIKIVEYKPLFISIQTLLIPLQKCLEKRNLKKSEKITLYSLDIKDFETT